MLDVIEDMPEDSIKIVKVSDLNSNTLLILNKISREIYGKNYDLDQLVIYHGEPQINDAVKINNDNRDPSWSGHMDLEETSNSGQHCPHSSSDPCPGFSSSCGYTIVLDSRSYSGGKIIDGDFAYDITYYEEDRICYNNLNWNNCCTYRYSTRMTYHSGIYRI